MQKKYGYIRVSTREQKEDRQMTAMIDVAVPAGHIYMDKQSGIWINNLEKILSVLNIVVCFIT